MKLPFYFILFFDEIKKKMVTMSLIYFIKMLQYRVVYLDQCTESIY